MAVLRQELTRTTFQDRQITLMKDISVDIRDLKKELGTDINSLKNALTVSFDKSIQGLYYSFVRYFETGTAAFISDISDLMDDLREGIDEDNNKRDKDDQRRQTQVDRYQQQIQNQNKEIISKITTVVSGISRLANMFGLSIDRYTDLANKYTDLENIAVKNTGLTREAIKSFRDNTLATVSALNSRSNNLYSGVESFELLVGLINQTGIKNTKFYEEYGEIFLESQKTMNINLSTLAEFADKFYRKYNLSSDTMGSIVEEVRKNTAGTSTSEEQLLELMNTLDTDITHAVLLIGGDKATQESNRKIISGNIQSTYTWLNENGLNGDYLTKLVTGAMGNELGSEMTLLKYLGFSGNSASLTEAFMNDPSGFMIWLVNKIGSKQLGSDRFGREKASLYGLDFDTAQTAEIALREGRISKSSYENFLANRQYSKDPNAQQWMSAEDRTANATEEISATLSDAQESLGIKFSTVSNMLTTIKDVIVGAFALNGGGLWSLIGTGGTGNSSILGALGPYGAMAAVIALAGDAVIHAFHSSDAVNKYSEQLTGVYKDSYGSVSASGVVTSREKPSTIKEMAQSSENAYNAAITKTNAQSKGILGNLITPATRWISKNIFGYDDETLDRNYAENSTQGAVYSVKYNNPMWETARQAAKAEGTFFGKDPDDTMLRMLQAYESKGYLKDPRMYSWISGSSTKATPLYAKGITKSGIVELDDGRVVDYGEQKVLMLEHALDTFKNEGKLVIPIKNILGTQYDSNDWTTVPAYKRGTNYIPNDQLALLHEGEAVIPAESNPFDKYSSIDRYSYLRDIAITSKNLESGSNSMKTVVEYLSRILLFMESWKSDNEESDEVRDILESARNMNIKLQLYTGSSSVASDAVG